MKLDLSYMVENCMWIEKFILAGFLFALASELCWKGEIH